MPFLAHILPSVLRERVQKASQRLEHVPLPTNVPLRPAAVLVPLVYQNEQWSLLLTRRTNALANHKGQVAFPGGGYEKEDGDLVATALRETFEELGIPPEKIDIIGQLPQQPVISGYVVTPVVAILPGDVPLRPTPDEIARVFFVPLAWLADPAHIERVEKHRWHGLDYSVPFYIPYEGEIIWGMTARIILSLLQTLAPPFH